MSNNEEDDYDDYRFLYDSGRWEWDEDTGSLIFKCEAVQESCTTVPLQIGAMDFRDDLDLFEQQRYRKRYQRKTTDLDVVMLQDIKDLVIYTACKYLLTPNIIRILHLSATERFLRALILYCQYFGQISETMQQRSLERQMQVPNSLSNVIEAEFTEDLQDLRVLIAKEYSLLIQGDGEFRRYHHMGSHKNCTSLYKADAKFFESFLKICTQIVWLALGRYAHNQIEFEIQRLFKSNKYNYIEHQSTDMNWLCDIDESEAKVLLGPCVVNKRNMRTQSPLYNEFHCHRTIDYRLYGLGVVKYSNLCPRLKFFERLLIAPENKFTQYEISLGILGLPRNRFDITLKEIKIVTASASSTSIRSLSRRFSYRPTTTSCLSTRRKLISPIVLPKKLDDMGSLPEHFPKMYRRLPRIDEVQKAKWIAYISRILNRTENKQTRN